MDYPLGVGTVIVALAMPIGLNPYSNGLPSRGLMWRKDDADGQVLIPILMDYPLGEVFTGRNVAAL